MDRDAFVGLTKILGASPNRRTALGTLLCTGLAGILTTADAKKGRKHKRQGGTGGRASLTAEAADCLNPGPSSNISGCPFQNEDFSGDDLSGSRMVATNFRGADLIETNLSSSNARNAIFREADLTCANLRSSTLGGADFRAADLTLVNLKSSGGCNSATFNAATFFCGTTMCDGSIRNDDCPSGFDPDIACCSDADCGPGGRCLDNQCLGACEETGNPIGQCICASRADGQGIVCVGNSTLQFCSPGNTSCPPGAICVFNPCGPSFVCQESCPSLAPCVCASAPSECGSEVLCGDANPF